MIHNTSTSPDPRDPLIEQAVEEIMLAAANYGENGGPSRASIAKTATAILTRLVAAKDKEIAAVRAKLTSARQAAERAYRDRERAEATLAQAREAFTGMGYRSIPDHLRRLASALTDDTPTEGK